MAPKKEDDKCTKKYYSPAIKYNIDCWHYISNIIVVLRKKNGDTFTSEHSACTSTTRKGCTYTGDFSRVNCAADIIIYPKTNHIFVKSIFWDMCWTHHMSCGERQKSFYFILKYAYFGPKTLISISENYFGTCNRVRFS